MYLNEPPEIQMIELLNEPVYTEATTITIAPILKTILKEKEVTFTPPATPPTKTKAKRIDEQKARFGSTKPSQSKRTHDDQEDPDSRKGEKKGKRRRKDVSESSSKKSKAQEVPPHFETCNYVDEPRQDDEQVC
nr:hypothetical protein [Tanacetum cinerariifolium]